MIRFVARRFAQAVVVLVGLSIGSFVLIHLLPGDPAVSVLGLRATPSALVRVRWRPTSGHGTAIGDPLRALVVPTLAVGLVLEPLLIRTPRSGVLDVLASDFVIACRARGLSELRVVTRHVLPNALIATVTVLG